MRQTRKIFRFRSTGDEKTHPVGRKKVILLIFDPKTQHFEALIEVKKMDFLTSNLSHLTPAVTTSITYVRKTQSFQFFKT